MSAAQWFDVDREGLAALVERRGKVFILHELLQNAWDCADVNEVAVSVEAVPGRPLARLSVTDDSADGFRDLAHAYTLFAPSEKKGDPNRRGRFNLGEKLVLALCEDAEIVSTRGSVRFGSHGRHKMAARRQFGSEFRASVHMTREELTEVLAEIQKIIPPTHIKTSINGKEIPHRTAVKHYESLLQTEVADDTGIVRRKFRETRVNLYNLRQGERATLYEMGVPIMELGDDPYHIDVGQKVPMGMERDAVTPAYLKDLRGGVLDNMHSQLSPDTARGKWTGDAIEEATNLDAIKAVVTRRFGDKVVIADPSDHEGTQIAASQGYAVIQGGTFTSEAWDKIREAGAALPAGQVTPSPKPFSPDGTPLKLIPEEKWTPAMCIFHDFAVRFAADVAQLSIGVEFTTDRSWKFNAAYSKTGQLGGSIIFNLGLLGNSFWKDYREQLRLLFHELAHHWGGHLDHEYHEKLCWLAAEAVRQMSISSSLSVDLKMRFGSL